MTIRSIWATLKGIAAWFWFVWLLTAPMSGLLMVLIGTSKLARGAPGALFDIVFGVAVFIAGYLFLRPPAFWKRRA